MERHTHIVAIGHVKMVHKHNDGNVNTCHINAKNLGIQIVFQLAIKFMQIRK